MTAYWPNSGQVLQQLNYISSSQVLSLTPGGNSVILNMSTPVQQTLSSFVTMSADVANIQQGNFSSIQAGGEALLYQNIASAIVGNLNATTASISTLTSSNAAVGNLYNAVGQTAVGTISSLTVSSINGSAYMPGGGGGSNNPNPSFSTININSGGGIVMNTDDFGNTPVLQFNTAADGTLSENLLFKDAPAGGLSDGGRLLTLQYFTPGVNRGGIFGCRGIDFAPNFAGEAVAGIIGVSADTASIYLEGVSSINGQVPGGGGSIPSDLIVSTITAGGANLSSIGTVGKGIIQVTSGLTAQANVEVQGTLLVDAGIEVASGQQLQFVGGLGNISGLSTINGDPFTPYIPSNVKSAFVTGSDIGGGIWQVNVDSNTSGAPQQLTSTITLNSSHSYLVNYNMTSGSNTDTTFDSITRLYAYCAGANDINMKNYNGFSNYWVYNGSAGSVSAIIKGASATRLYATNASPTVSTVLYFDSNTSFSVTDLGTSS